MPFISLFYKLRLLRLEQIGCGDSPVAVLPFDGFVVVAYAYVFECVGQAEAVACGNLHVREQLDTEPEVPCNVAALVFDELVNVFLAYEERKARTGGYERLYQAAYARHT